MVVWALLVRHKSKHCCVPLAPILECNMSSLKNPTTASDGEVLKLPHHMTDKHVTVQGHDLFLLLTVLL